MSANNRLYILWTNDNVITAVLPTAHMEPFRDRVNGATPRPG